jgi:hypothetical protein
MEPACIKNARVSAFNTTPLIDDDLELLDDGRCVIDADGNVFDQNGKFIGYTWEAVRDELTRKMSEEYGVDFFKVDRMKASGMLKEKDITNELLLSSEFKYEPYPGFKPTPPQKPTTNDPEWEAAMEEVIAAFENDDEDGFEDEFESSYTADKE